MKQNQTTAIILTRTDYGEADRIITVLTPDHGKLSLMARGVRRVKSKLAGSIELFSTAEISYMNGRGRIGTLLSARLITYYSNILQDIDRVQLGYELIKVLHRATEDEPEPEYFELLKTAFEALNSDAVSGALIRLWFQAQLLRFAGHTPNLMSDVDGNALLAGQTYQFDFDAVAFRQHQNGEFTTDAIKFLRLVFSGNTPRILSQVQGVDKLVPGCVPLVQTMLQTYIRI